MKVKCAPKGGQAMDADPHLIASHGSENVGTLFASGYQDSDLLIHDGNNGEDVQLCEVPILEINVDTDFGLAIENLRGCDRIVNKSKPKKKRGRPRKNGVCSEKRPSQIAEHVWGIGKVLGVSNVGEDNNYVKILEEMEVRDMKAGGKGDLT
ncbi:hypothetical protein SESBI_50025 [Sesbania bispinosa]|nr:hypothetical protein SESBI_50025 [Sesbania bispinosa]